MNILGRVKDKVTQHVDVYVRLFKLNFIARTSNVLSYFIFMLICLFILFCILLFSGLCVTEVFMRADIPKAESFLITIGIYFLFLAGIVLARRPITRFFASGIIREMTKGDDDEERKEEKNENE